MSAPAERCAMCGADLPSRRQRTGRPATYCSNACRQRAYRRRQATGDVDVDPDNAGQPRPKHTNGISGSTSDASASALAGGTPRAYSSW